VDKNNSAGSARCSAFPHGDDIPGMLARAEVGPVSQAAQNLAPVHGGGLTRIMHGTPQRDRGDSRA
jgi:hypothetical protein